MIKAILFDFDGTILDTEYPEYLSWCTVYESFGCTLPLDKWLDSIGRGAATFDPYAELAILRGEPVDRDAVRATRRAHFAEQMRDAPLLPGIEPLLIEAKEGNIRCAVVSSSPREWIMRYLPLYGIESYFHSLCTGCEVVNTKPDPDLYLLALERLQLAPDEVVALEDSPNGVRAAQAAGIFCVAVPNRMTRNMAFHHADHVLPSLYGITVSHLNEHRQAAVRHPR